MHSYTCLFESNHVRTTLIFMSLHAIVLSLCNGQFLFIFTNHLIYDDDRDIVIELDGPLITRSDADVVVLQKALEPNPASC